MFREVRAAVIEVIILAGVALYIWRRWKSEAVAVLPSADDLKRASRDIAAGLPSVVSSLLKGETDQRYITSEQQKVLAAAALAAKRAQAATLAGREG